MSRSTNRPRILLIQVREEPDIEIQEQTCFVERAQLEPTQLYARSVIRHSLTSDWLDEHDAMMIGGAGAFSATQDYEWTEAVLDLIRAAVDRGYPTFGSCWGHQMIARAMGGTVVHDASLAEMGCHEVSLTDAGKADALFAHLPASFLANMGHHDRVTSLPPGGVELARNDQPNQAFRLGALPIYGTQFHSELDAHRERERLIRYRQHYPDELHSEEVFRSIVDSLAETTEVDALLAEFVKVHVNGDS